MCGDVLNNKKRKIIATKSRENDTILVNRFKRGEKMDNFSEDVRLARSGSTEAFARLYSAVYKDLYHIALYSLRSSHDACDAVSDTVLDAYCNIGDLKNEKAFRSWIMRILSAKIKRKQREYFKDTIELTEENEPSGEFIFEVSELKQAMEQLDPQSRLLLSMSVLEGYTSEEISEICDMNPNTVRSKLARIKHKLRLELT